MRKMIKQEQVKEDQIIRNTFDTGSKVAACEYDTSVNEAGSGLEATSATNVRLCTSRRACKESCHKSSTNLQQQYKGAYLSFTFKVEEQMPVKLSSFHVY